MSKSPQGQCLGMGEDDLFPPRSLFVHENATLTEGRATYE